MAPPPPAPSQLQEMAQAAFQKGSNVFTVPQSPVRVGSRVTIYYNRAKGPIPGSTPLKVKLGLNKWEDILTLDASAVAELEQLRGAGQVCKLLLYFCYPWGTWLRCNIAD